VPTLLVWCEEVRVGSERVVSIVEPVVAAAGLELFDLEVKPRLVRVTVDRPEGVDLDTIAEVTNRISAALDEHDAVPGGPYALEVSSPGVERPLRRPDEYERYVGSTISVKTHPHVEGERRIQATLDRADDDGIEIAGRRLAYADIERARTVLEWGPAPKPGKGSRPKKREAQKT
jgi:ribosome maturation factor RimP